MTLPVSEDEEESDSGEEAKKEEQDDLPIFIFKVRLFHSRTALQVGHLEHLEALVEKEH